MAFYVYIIQSLPDNSFYKGFSEDPLKRLSQHNAGETPSTCLIPLK
jgi:putative endonuclease